MCGTRYKNLVTGRLLENSFPHPPCFQPFRSITKQSHQQLGWLFYPLSRKTWWGLEPSFSVVLYVSAILCTPCAHETAWKSCNNDFNPWRGNSRMPSIVGSCVVRIQISQLKSRETWEGESQCDFMRWHNEVDRAQYILIRIRYRTSELHERTLLASGGILQEIKAYWKGHSRDINGCIQDVEALERDLEVSSSRVLHCPTYWMWSADKPCKNSEEPL